MESTNQGLMCGIKNLINSGNEIYSDFSVEVEDEIFPCHRFVLSSCSPFFQTLLRSDMKETRRNCVSLGDISSETFKLIYGCIYLNEQLNEDNFLDVWRAAHLLQIDFILSSCQKIAMETINEQNCHRYFWYAKLLDTKVMSKILEYITSNFDQFKDSNCVMELEGEELLALVRDANLRTRCKDNVVNAIQKWVRHSDAHNRTDFFIKLLSVPRLALLRLKDDVSIFDQILNGDKSKSLELIENVSNYLLGGRVNYRTAFSSKNRRALKEDMVMVQSGCKYIDIYSLKEQKIVGILDSSALPPNTVLGSHRKQMYACGYTAYNVDSLSMFLMLNTGWQKVSNLRYCVSMGQRECTHKSWQLALFPCSIRDRVFVVQTLGGNIFEWHPVKRTDLKVVTYVPCEFPIIHATPYRSSIIVICSNFDTSAFMFLYDTVRHQWGSEVPLEGIRSQDDIISFYKEDTLYMLTSEGALYEVEKARGGVTLRNVAKISDFSYPLIDAVVYNGDLFLFVREYAVFLVTNTYPKSKQLPELFNNVYVIGARYSATSVVRASLPQII